MIQIKKIEDLIKTNQINEAESVINNILSNNDLKETPASTYHHHAWKGGLLDHIDEVASIAIYLLKNLPIINNNQLILEQTVIIIALVHDLEKLWKYEVNSEFNSDNQISYYNKPYKVVKTPYLESDKNMVSLNRWYQLGGKLLKGNDLKCITFTEGGWSDITKTNPYANIDNLSSIIHTADLLSANIYGKEKRNDARYI